MAKESAGSLAAQPIGAVMLRTTNPQHSLWEAILPDACLGLPAELARVDTLLDDPAFLAPLAAHFDPRLGRPSIPLDTYLRMMFLKFRYRLGYELLCREVTDSISWQRFCRIPLGAQVPHATTLVKLTRRLGEQTVAALNQALLATAAEHKVLRTHRVRADTTVVAANVAYPTDAGLLARAIGKLAATIGRIQAAGGAGRTRVRDRRRAARRRAHQLARTLRGRTEQAKQAVLRTTGELADLAERAMADAARVACNARRGLGRAGDQASGELARLVDDLETAIGRTGQVIGQTRTRLAGGTPDGASRLVSLHDPDARPIVKGRLGKPVEFGDKAQVADNPDGVVLDYQIEVGNPADAPLLAPAVKRIAALAGRTPRAVTADRSYGEAAVDQDLRALGVERVAIPRKGQPGAARRATEHARGFRRLVKWRTGSEGRISHLKHRFGWDRTGMDGIDGARIWCGHGVLAHNLVKISGLLEAKQTG
jgi:transposase, IS5 family